MMLRKSLQICFRYCRLAACPRHIQVTDSFARSLHLLFLRHVKFSEGPNEIIDRVRLELVK